MLSKEVGKDRKRREVAEQRKRKREEEPPSARNSEGKNGEKKRWTMPESPTTSLVKRRKLSVSRRKANPPTRQKQTPAVPCPTTPKPVYGLDHNVLIPEVFVTTSPSKSALTRSQTASQRLCASPGGHWQRAAAYDISGKRPRATWRTKVVSNDGGHVDVDDDSDVLPNDFSVPLVEASGS
jgi:hypothetical protein